MSRQKQSLARLTAKHAIRTAGRRAVSSTLGANTLVGAIANTLLSFAVRKTDSIKHNANFDMFYIDDKNNVNAKVKK